MDKDDILYQTIGELKEANRNIAESMHYIKDNLKTLNDHNILHATNTSSDHESIINQIQILTGKYWWLIIGLIVALLTVMGYKDAINSLI